jgi:DNA-binding transcriptional regulator YhcF (GntR family)
MFDIPAARKIAARLGVQPAYVRRTFRQVIRDMQITLKGIVLSRPSRRFRKPFQNLCPFRASQCR